MNDRLKRLNREIKEFEEDIERDKKLIKVFENLKAIEIKAVIVKSDEERVLGSIISVDEIINELELSIEDYEFNITKLNNIIRGIKKNESDS